MQAKGSRSGRGRLAFLLLACAAGCEDSAALCQAWGCDDPGLTISAEVSDWVPGEALVFELTSEGVTYTAECTKSASTEAASCSEGEATSLSEGVTQVFEIDPTEVPNVLELRVAVVDRSDDESLFIGPTSFQLCATRDATQECSGTFTPEYSERRDPGCKTCAKATASCQVGAAAALDCQ